jgi:hypothetical protein
VFALGRRERQAAEETGNSCAGVARGCQDGSRACGAGKLSMKARLAVAVAVAVEVAGAAGSSNEQAAEKGVAAAPKNRLSGIGTRSTSVGAWQERKASRRGERKFWCMSSKRMLRRQ